eukprot:6482453-Amphidinium_carterae.2
MFTSLYHRAGCRLSVSRSISGWSQAAGAMNPIHHTQSLSVTVFPLGSPRRKLPEDQVYL